MPLPNRAGNALAVLAAALAAVFILVPCWQLLGPGPLDWHVRQPAFVQGGLEAIGLAVLLGLGFAVTTTRLRLLISVLPLAFYLRRHGVDIPVLIDVIYLEIVIGAGLFVQRRCGIATAREVGDYLQAFVIGLLCWSTLAWIASACGMGSIHALRVLTLLLAVPALSSRQAPLTVFLSRNLGMLARTDRAWCGVLVAWTAVLFARTKVAFGYDSLWYGLRGEYVLDPGHSVFEALGLVSPVHYFPKLYEVFLLPVSALGDASVIEGMSILLYVLVLLACHRLAIAIGVPARARLPTIAAIATLPALAASAGEPKPDVAAALFLLLAAQAAIASRDIQARRTACWLFVCLTLACCAKLTAIPYAGALVVAVAIACWRARTRDPANVPPPDEAADRLATMAAIATAAVAALVTARTWLLTGMPTVGPDPLYRLWTTLGLSLHAPAGTLHWAQAQDWSDLPALCADWLFRPQRLPHVVITWVGNVWAWLALLAAVAAACGLRAAPSRVMRLPLLALIGSGLALALCIRYMVRGSDGNYFLAALLPAILLSARSAFVRLAAAPRALACALMAMPAFAAMQAADHFATGAWTPGTRPFDGRLERDWREGSAMRWRKLESGGLGRIGRHVEQLGPLARGVGFAREPESFWLPSRFESLTSILFARPEYVFDGDGFRRFLREQRIDYLILPQAGAADDLYVAPTVIEVAASLQHAPEVRRIDDRDYYLLDLRARDRD